MEKNSNSNSNSNGKDQNYGMEIRGGNEKPAPSTQKPAQRPPSQIKDK